MWGLAPDYQMLQADGQGEERTRLMVALIGLQKAPKPGNRKKKKASLTAQDIRPTGLLKHCILCAWFGSWVPESGFWLNISSKAFRNGVHEKKKKKKEMKEKRKTFPLCGKESCYYWGFPAWRVLFIGGFAWMCCSWRVGVNMCLSVGLQTSSSASIQECLGLYQGTIIQEN